MARVRRNVRWLKKYLKKTENEKRVEAKPVKLSFTIQKAPERKKIEIEPPKPKKTEQTKDVEERKTVEVPKEFQKIAKKFGLPEDHLEFFYEHRDSFNWEMKKEFVVHCSERGCKLIVNEARGCLNEHMISVHDYKDIPCEPAKAAQNRAQHLEPCFTAIIQSGGNYNLKYSAQ
ncbi:Oidioi.mRNA.OKI2018_I69.PAR.g8458.t1.cds [Oikopleura dioica]|uniref:Oidioi.mRNA.OKI2018_I69.PAR.g8458.t1.cds n=1 Tax=Oikopleura dioica TaxID=34765 RepID=A0ABN7RJJ8_OIKDI|nr:Oidioi.mRNA.OKI2018_I69.PAR.g8458.t1.cds [Oikopleura dioica]